MWRAPLPHRHRLASSPSPLRCLRTLPVVPSHRTRPSAVPRRLKSTHSTPTPSSARKGQKLRVAPATPHPPPSHPTTAQPPPHIGPPRLIRYPATPDTHVRYARAPSSRLFDYYNAATATSSGRSTGWSSSTSTASPSTSFLPPRKRLPTSTGAAVTSDMENSSVDQSKAAGLRQRASAVVDNGKIETEHRHYHGSSWLPHAHSHPHSPSHSHGAESSAEEADRLLAALKGKGDRGSNITVVGLIANLVLCGGKGLAGVWLHSASLLADAAHSLSDTFSDIVTLFCWKMSQKPASITHPLGYGKFETMGGLGVSVVLVAGAFAIGMHSYGLLLEVLQPALQNAPSGLQALSSWTGGWAKAAGSLMHEGHDAAGSVLAAGEKAKGSVDHSGGVLDPNAMWFALISILVKEWLYRATLKIAKEENSSVLEANAIHHRSDSLSSGVTFLAIGGSYLGFPVLDPLGGLLVAGLIGKQGAELLIGALQDLSDRGVQPEVLEGFENALKEVMEELENEESNQDSTTRLAGWTDLRAVRSGVSSFVDVTLVMSEETKLKAARVVEQKVRERIMAAHKGVKEVRVHLDTEGHFEDK